MKYVSSILLVALASCGTTHFQVEGGQAAGDHATKTKSDCTGSCDATMNCTPDGHCVITCTNAAGGHCEVELACDGQGGCEVVRSDCSGSACGASQSANKPVK